jgi:hypothetical protein
MDGTSDRDRITPLKGFGYCFNIWNPTSTIENPGPPIEAISVGVQVPNSNGQYASRDEAVVVGLAGPVVPTSDLFFAFERLKPEGMTLVGDNSAPPTGVRLEYGWERVLPDGDMEFVPCEAEVAPPGIDAPGAPVHNSEPSLIEWIECDTFTITQDTPHLVNIDGGAASHAVIYARVIGGGSAGYTVAAYATPGDRPPLDLCATEIERPAALVGINPIYNGCFKGTDGWQLSGAPYEPELLKFYNSVVNWSATQNFTVEDTAKYKFIFSFKWARDGNDCRSSNASASLHLSTNGGAYSQVAIGLCYGAGITSSNQWFVIQSNELSLVEGTTYSVQVRGLSANTSTTAWADNVGLFMVPNTAATPTPEPTQSPTPTPPTGATGTALAQTATAVVATATAHVASTATAYHSTATAQAGITPSPGSGSATVTGTVTRTPWVPPVPTMGDGSRTPVPTPTMGATPNATGTALPAAPGAWDTGAIQGVEVELYRIQDAASSRWPLLLAPTAIAAFGFMDPEPSPLEVPYTSYENGEVVTKWAVVDFEIWEGPGKALSGFIVFLTGCSYAWNWWKRAFNAGGGGDE